MISWLQRRWNTNKTTISISHLLHPPLLKVLAVYVDCGHRLDDDAVGQRLSMVMARIAVALPERFPEVLSDPCPLCGQVSGTIAFQVSQKCAK